MLHVLTCLASRHPRFLGAMLALLAFTPLAHADDPRLSATTLSGLEMRSIGPAFMSGRIADIAIHPEDQSTWYVAVGSGGVWKTTNAGTTWSPIFDEQASYSIGALAIDPSRPDTIWVGSGEAVDGRHVGFGDGIYRSQDGGNTWENLGLAASEHIARIIVHPTNSNVVYVAAKGPLWSSGGDRGLFMTEDGGASWTNVLSAGPYTGVNEVVMHPDQPNVLYASTHQRARTVAALINGGPETAIYKSTDGGKQWRKLSTGLPSEDMGRVGLAISPQDPNVVYATIELAHRKGGFYRSADGGETWEKRNDYISGGTGPHYYQELVADPHNFDTVYQMDVRMHVTHDGGKTFTVVPHKYKHSDNHALVFSPTDPDWMLAGCDGGLYETFDRADTWKYVANLPVTQFYKVAVDYDVPFYNVIGGTQDNATQAGPSRTDSANGIRNSDWFITVFGDGHQPAIDPTNPDIIYSEWQQGNLVRHDRRSGEVVYIKPQPREGEPSERFNWDSPILISPHKPSRLYYASSRVWRSEDYGDSWLPASTDLTRQIDRLEEPMMGRVWSSDAVWDTYAMSAFSTITSLAESPLQEGLLYAGTDDGLIQVSENGGETWRKIDRLPGVADMFFVNDIKADLHDPNTVYVAVDQHKTGDFAPYLFRSTDRGRTWESIAGNLPDRHLVWRMVQDEVQPDLMFVGTEFGLFFTVDGGGNWVKLSGGVPNIPFRDLAIQRREHDLVGATFGRGFYILDDYTPLRDVSEDQLAEEFTLFPVRDAPWYVERRTLGQDGAAYQGDAFYVAPNPDFGAIFTYYLRDDLKTAAQRRDAEQAELVERGADTPYPGWETLIGESREEAPKLVFTVHNAEGKVVQHIEQPAKAGFHRVAWNLRYPRLEAWTPNPGGEEYIPTGGALAPPGTYSVTAAKRVDGKLTRLGEPQTFEVVSIVERALEGRQPAVAFAFNRAVDKLEGQTSAAGARIDAGMERVTAVRSVLLRTAEADPTLGERAYAIGKALSGLKDRLQGNEMRAMANDPGTPSVGDRLFHAGLGRVLSTYGPTHGHEMSLRLAETEFAKIATELTDLLDVQLVEIEMALDAAGAPWTPGRAATQ
ncbi:MAG: glycosyl hydrolase [Pseudomonadota bacterium]